MNGNSRTNGSDSWWTKVEQREANFTRFFRVRFEYNLTLLREWCLQRQKTVDAEDSSSDGAFEELHKHINDVYDILKHETNKLRKEKEAFDEVAKKLEHVHFSKMLKLNVGGHMFTTSLETMTKDPGNLTVT